MAFKHKHVFGWKPSVPSCQDKILKMNFFTAAPLPVKADMLDSAPPIWNQESIGSCTAHGAGRSFAHIVFQETGKQFMPSRLALYALTRFLEGTLNDDAGGTVRDAVKVLVKYGVPPESMWPYLIANFKTLPPQAVLNIAEKYQALQYYRIPDNDPNKLELIKKAIVEKHCPIFGIPLYESFEKVKSTGTLAGVVPMPTKREKFIGGHCMAVEYYDSKLKFKGIGAVGYQGIANSWTTGWGKKGYALISDEYMFRYASDIWVLTQTEIGR